jgi:hypothetical protein
MPHAISPPDSYMALSDNLLKQRTNLSRDRVTGPKRQNPVLTNRAEKRYENSIMHRCAAHVAAYVQSETFLAEGVAVHV